MKNIIQCLLGLYILNLAFSTALLVVDRLVFGVSPHSSSLDHFTGWLVSLIILSGFVIAALKPVCLSWILLRFNRYRILPSLICLIFFYGITYLVVRLIVTSSSWNALLQVILLPGWPTLLAIVIVTLCMPYGLRLWRKNKRNNFIALFFSSMGIVVLLTAFYAVAFVGLAKYYPSYYDKIFTTVFFQKNLSLDVKQDSIKIDLQPFSNRKLSNPLPQYNLMDWQLSLDVNKIEKIGFKEKTSKETGAINQSVYITKKDPNGYTKLTITPNHSSESFLAIPSMHLQPLPENYLKDKCYTFINPNAYRSPFDYDILGFLPKVNLENVIKTNSMLKKLCFYAYANAAKASYDSQEEMLINYAHPSLNIRSYFSAFRYSTHSDTLLIDDEFHRSGYATVGVKDKQKSKYLTIQIEKIEKHSTSQQNMQNPMFYHDDKFIVSLLSDLRYQPLHVPDMAKKVAELKTIQNSGNSQLANQLQVMELLLRAPENENLKELYKQTRKKK
ncbi:MAG: hypothetical protein V4629_00330 [Pseudomonadota bacterium]